MNCSSLAPQLTAPSHPKTPQLNNSTTESQKIALIIFNWKFCYIILSLAGTAQQLVFAELINPFLESDAEVYLEHLFFSTVLNKRSKTNSCVLNCGTNCSHSYMAQVLISYRLKVQCITQAYGFSLYINNA